MKEFWNERYSEPNFAYGCNPNDFLKQNLFKIKKGKLLFPAEGEGRNAVFAAQNGFEVEAFDISKSGKEKADALAKQCNITINYQVGTLEQLPYLENSFNGIILIYAHLPSEIRKDFHKQLMHLVKPGGIILFEAFSKEQLQFTSGGPKNSVMLFSEEEVKEEFSGLKFEFLSTEIIDLNEGKYHQGRASVVRFIAYKL